MRLLLALAIAMLLVAPTVEAGEDTGTTSSDPGTSSSSGSTTTASSGPEPSGCRPYCLSS